MRKNIFFLIFMLVHLSIIGQELKVSIDQPQIPVMVDRSDNIIAQIEIDNPSGDSIQLNQITAEIHFDNKAFTPKAMRLFYTGTMSVIHSNTASQAISDLFKRVGGSQNIYMNPAYSILESEVKTFVSEMRFASNRLLVKGKNYFFLSMEVAKYKDLTSPFRITVKDYTINGNKKAAKEEDVPRRLAVGVRQAGDDGVYSYRIPALVQSKKGTLVAAYDIRWSTNVDLQEHIEIGVSRSLDKGRTWNKMQTAVSMGQWGGLPKSQNGVGDPCLLLDDVTGEMYIFGSWLHGKGNARAWLGSSQGLDPLETGQLVYAKSSDDGKTWSSPVNITTQVKHPAWYYLLQGPGTGITMKDGTLVVPIQYIDSTKIPSAAIMYSQDRGKTWTTHKAPEINTTESQVAEIAPGILMLNMRDNRAKGRSIFMTDNLGRTWTEHSTSKGVLNDPVCMASFIRIDKKDNILNQDILLFASPNTVKRSDRSAITIKASLDKGETWWPENQLLLDQEKGWGYTSMTLLDKETIGILYEASTGQIIFQAVKLVDIIQRETPPVSNLK